MSGCEHTWKSFNNNDDPLTDGLSAGLYSPSNPAFVGMTKVGKLFRPSRIQVTGNVGAYVLDYTFEAYSTNENYYLVDNPNFRYHWVDARGNDFFMNSVAVNYANGPFSFPIGRAVINGRTVIGHTNGVGGLIYADEEGEQHVVGQYQILVCEAVPKYKCGEYRWIDGIDLKLESTRLRFLEVIGKLWTGVDTLNY